MVDLTERGLVDRMRKGDEHAFDEFFSSYFPRLLRFAMARLGNEDAAEEVVQATLIHGVRQVAAWRAEASLFTWLCAICRREIAALAGRSARRISVPLEDDDPQVRAALEAIGASSESPEAALARGDLGRLVRLALDYLPPHYSRVLEWKYLDELSVHDIAARLGTTPKAVESLLTRARGAFREGFAALQQRTRES